MRTAAKNSACGFHRKLQVSKSDLWWSVENVSLECRVSAVTAKILFILSARYWGTGNSWMSAKKTFITWTKLKFFRASGREGRQRKLSTLVTIPPVIKSLWGVYQGNRLSCMLGNFDDSGFPMVPRTMIIEWFGVKEHFKIIRSNACSLFKWLVAGLGSVILFIWTEQLMKWLHSTARVLSIWKT